MIRRSSSSGSSGSLDGGYHGNTRTTPDVIPTATTAASAPHHRHDHSVPAATGAATAGAAAATAAKRHHDYYNYNTHPYATTPTGNSITTYPTSADSVTTTTTSNTVPHTNTSPRTTTTMNNQTPAYTTTRSTVPSNVATTGPTTTTTTSNATTVRNAEVHKKHHGACFKCCICLFCIAIAAVIAGVLTWHYLPENDKQNANELYQSRPMLNVPGPNQQPPAYGYKFDQCTSQQNCCNGLSNICDLPANKIMYASVHNAEAAAQDGFRLSPNNIYRLDFALERGYRGLSIDVGRCDGNIVLMHGDCRLGSFDMVTEFTRINNFLEQNPNEVLFISLELNESGGSITGDEIYSILKKVKGFTNRLVTINSSNPVWPTLSEMIAKDQRVMFFTFNGKTKCTQGNCPAGIYDYFSYTAETEFEFDTVNDIKNTQDACKITRGPQGAPDFLGISVFTRLPSESAASTANQKSFLENQINKCSKANDMMINLVYVDFWSKGDLVEVVQEYNKQLKPEGSQSSSNTSVTTSTGGNGRQRFLRNNFD